MNIIEALRLSNVIKLKDTKIDFDKHTTVILSKHDLISEKMGCY